LEEKIIELLKTYKQDVSNVIIDRIERTGNNKAAIVRTNNAIFFAKNYFNSTLDNRDRFNSEISFFEYSKECAPNFIPKIHAFDTVNKIILFENILGSSLKSDDLNTEIISTAATFFSLLNRPEFKFSVGKKINTAAEACFSINSHLILIEQRIIKLENTVNNQLEEISASNIVNLIRTAFEQIKSSIFLFAHQNSVNIDLDIQINERVISPSDFGFHNCLIKENKDLIFFDFEYSGWDDPAKVTGDFFSQLQVPVSEKYFDTFVNIAFDSLTNKKELITRCKLLLPLYKIKWACIAMNIFIPINLERRLFSNPNLDIKKYKTEQIQKAKNILNKIQITTNVIY
jgi:hypothetical protein